MKIFQQFSRKPMRSLILAFGVLASTFGVSVAQADIIIRFGHGYSHPPAHQYKFGHQHRRHGHHSRRGHFRPRYRGYGHHWKRQRYLGPPRHHGHGHHKRFRQQYLGDPGHRRGHVPTESRRRHRN